MPGVNPWHGFKMTDVIICKSLHWPECVRKACNHADTICQGLSQGLCQERICQELNPWQDHLWWADLLVILLLAKLLANVHLPRLSAFCQGFCPWKITRYLVVNFLYFFLIHFFNLINILNYFLHAFYILSKQWLFVTTYYCIHVQNNYTLLEHIN